MSEIKLTTGDSFLINCVHKDPEGVPVNLIVNSVSVAAYVINEKGDKLDLIPISFDQEDFPGKFGFKSDTLIWRKLDKTSYWKVVIRITDVSNMKFSVNFGVILDD